MLRVGLTGGIGSGKSMVVARLAQLGALVIDSDRIAREVVDVGTAGWRAVVDEFGREVLTADGTLDRLALAALVFDDADALTRLNGIVHPLVAARSAELVTAAPAEAIVVQDIPLLVEAGMAAGFPVVVVVHADTMVRLRRLVEQRGMTESDASARIAAQASDEQRRAAADVWLDNSGDRSQTVAAVDRLWGRRLVPFEANLRHHRRAPRTTVPLLVASDGGWPQQARRVVERIATVSGRRAHRIDHIGSTAVPGLDARDVLDVQVVVNELDTAGQLADDLIDAGLIRLGGLRSDTVRDGTTWNKAVATNADPDRAVDCHVRPVDSPAWREALLFRDWLRAHPAGVRDYAHRKHRLAARTWDCIASYRDAKAPFVSSALDQAERWALRSGWQLA